MDRITHITNKLMAERARQTEQPMHTLPPPPYTAPADDEADSDDDEDSEEPLRLTINAQHHIQGSHNLVPTSPTPLADATKFSTLLVSTLNQLNANAQPSRRKLKLDLTINCGVTVIGDRNVIGNVGVKPKAQPVNGAPTAVGMAPISPTSVSGESAVAGAKRRAEEDTDTDEPAAKRPALNGMQRDE